MSRLFYSLFFLDICNPKSNVKTLLMQDLPNIKQPIEDEITLKDIILKLQHWWSVV